MDTTATSEFHTKETSPLVYDLGDCLFNATCGEITSKINQEHIHLEKKVAKVLECLAIAEGEIVTREHIFEQVWPNVVVSDDSLNRCISVIRKKLREFDHKVIIKTHPKVGFHLEYSHETRIHTEPIIDTEVLATSKLIDRRQNPNRADRKKQPAKHQPKIRLLVFGLSALLLFGALAFVNLIAEPTPLMEQIVQTRLLPKRIIIMPLKIDQEIVEKYQTFEQAYRQLIANNPEMVTVDRSALLSSTQLSAQEIATTFDARFIFKGTIKQQGTREILSWRLVDGETGDILLEKQLNIALNQEASNIRQITSEQVIAIAQRLYPQDINAQINYITLAADYLYQAEQNHTLHRPVITMLATTITNIAPNSAVALKKIAQLLIEEAWQTRRLPSPFIDLADNSLEKALTITPQDSQLLFLKAKLQATKYQWLQAKNTLAQSINQQSTVPENSLIPPNFSQYQLMYNTGYVSDEIISYYKQVFQLTPLSDKAMQRYLAVLIRQGNAMRALDELNNLGSSGKQWLAKSILLAATLIRAGNVEDGKQILIDGYQTLGVNQSYADVLYQGLRYPSFASQASDFLTQAANNNEFPSYLLIEMYAHLGDTERYYQLANNLAENRQFNMLSTMGDHAAHIRRSTEFQVLMNKIGILPYWQEYGFPHYCTFTDKLQCN